MSAPVVSTVNEYVDTLDKRFVPEATKGMSAVFQWELSGDDGRTFHAVVNDGAVEVCEGAHDSPKVTLKMNGADYVQVVNGKMNGRLAAMKGKLKVGGNIMMARKMEKIFPIAKK